MTRVVAGTAGGRVLLVPRGSRTRPTSERVREAIFSRLEHEAGLAGARVLDLYAGSGALGLEAASRGAGEVWLVESAAAAVAVCRRNVADLRLTGVRVVATDVERLLATGSGGPFDLVLADPPYALPEDDLARVLALLATRGWLTDAALVVVERSARGAGPTWPSALVPAGERRYGETRVWFAAARRDPGEPG